MTPAPLGSDNRANAAAHRVLVDLGQVLASYRDRLTLVGGMSPSLLFGEADPAHSGSMDVDLAMQADQLGNGEYAKLLTALLDAGYRLSADQNERFRFYVDVDLGDGQKPVVVPVDFLAAPGSQFQKDPDARLKGFRVLEADACANAFHAPQEVEIRDAPDIKGALNTVIWPVVAVEDLLIMKAFALQNRKKAKDAYDIVFCLDQLNQQERLEEVASSWRSRSEEPDIQHARDYLTDKFASPEHIGPQWYADFVASSNSAQDYRLAFELVQEFLKRLL
jgi:nucleotidyltransferase AbiEii toxin of type IV toxin-antitoxin system